LIVSPVAQGTGTPALKKEQSRDASIVMKGDPELAWQLGHLQ
jgi:hypothetical protein